MKELRKYGEVCLLDAKDIDPKELVEYDEAVTNIRAIFAASPESELQMQQMGFVLADRTLGVSINLPRSNLDFDRMVRMEIVETDGFKDEILEIAKKSFLYDRRFHIKPEIDHEIAGTVLAEWVAELDKVLVCLYKEKPIGFLALKDVGADASSVHLAAVDEKYRMTGAAMSLYAKAASLCKSAGIKRLEGRISSRNTAVMNIYSYLGATFASPENVFLKAVNDK